MHQITAVGPHQLFRGPAEMAFDARALVANDALGIQNGNNVGNIGNQRTERLVTLAQRLFHPFAITDFRLEFTV